MQEITILQNRMAKVENLAAEIDDLSVLLELALSEQDEAAEKEVLSTLSKLSRKVEQLELNTLLSGEYDNANAYLTIHPGAGGTESQDWAQMLMRMYLRWAERNGYKAEIIDLLPGDEAGIKSVTILIRGELVFGYLKAEKGVHRLVRISPFDASGRRHTSFVSVDVMPEMAEDYDLEIRPEDLKVDTFRSSGAGGQHVNKTESAIRITHIPSGIVVSCQTERSQIQNRATAMSLLKAKLAAKQREEQEEKLAEIRGEQKDIAWGSQIRSYVFCPYTMVKDHRTNYETGNIDAVMDGEIDLFIESYLRWKKS
jgi:peptide chain release factor 2